jgi:hypothetical protein
MKGRDHLDDIGEDGRVILKLILWKWDWIGFIWFRIETSGSL